MQLEQKNSHKLYSEWRSLKLSSNGGPLPKICHTYPSLMKLDTVIHYLNKTKISINEVAQWLSSAEINRIFHRKSATLDISRNTDTDFILIHNSLCITSILNIFESLKGCFNKSGCNFNDVSKLGYSIHS